MKRRKINPSWVVIACLAFWSFALLLLVSPSFSGSNSVVFTFLPLALMIAVLLTFVSAYILVFGLSTRNPKNEDYTHNSPVAKVLASLVVAAIVASTATAIKSLWYSPLNDNFGDRFVYENIATGVGFAGIVLTVFLSALQKDIYWVTRKKAIALDERQLQERREVFETSYKLGAFIVLIAVLWLNGKIHNVPAILANTYGSVPGHLYWIGVNLALTMFALPLVVAAWKKQ